jgi:hypothetical protein
VGFHDVQIRSKVGVRHLHFVGALQISCQWRRSIFPASMRMFRERGEKLKRAGCNIDTELFQW